MDGDDDYDDEYGDESGVGGGREAENEVDFMWVPS